MSYHGNIALPAHSSLYGVQILVGGHPLDLYRRQPDGRLFVALEPGWAYTLKVSNRTRGRLEVLVSVDGSDIGSDSPASIRNTGLVIPPLGSYEFRGWRVSDRTTRQFIAGGLDGSIADQSGRTGNTGVIGFAAYTEARQPHYGGILPGGPAGGLRTNTADGGYESAGPDLATHAGPEQADTVGRTHFDRSSGPEMLAIGYMTLFALQEAGIWGLRDPDPFPADRANATGYGSYRP